MRQSAHDQANILLRRTLADFRNLAKLDPANWPTLALVAVEVDGSGSVPADQHGFDSVIGALEAHTGWARFRSAVYWTGAAAMPDFSRDGPPLHGEWSVSTDTGVRVRLDPNNPGFLRKWIYTEREFNDIAPPDGDYRLFLREETVVLGQKRHLPGQMLLYNVYWGMSEGGDLCRVFDRFVGFSEEPAS